MSDAEALPHDPVGSLLQVLDLADSDARTTEDIFVGVSQPMPHGRVYGGQVLAQSIVAAQRTVPDDRVAHSMHGYFLRPGDASEAITFSVDRIHDGHSFSARRTQAFQRGTPIFSMISSFQHESTGLDHQVPMPVVPDPESLTPDDELLEGLHPWSQGFFRNRPVDIRHFPSAMYAEVAEGPSAHQAVWMRARRPLPDDPAVHRAALAYISDMTIQETILRAHGLSWTMPDLKLASLDHAMWWHRPGRVDDWLLYVQDSPSARAGRGLAQGRIYTREGALLATVAQQVMIRVTHRS